MKTNDKVYAVFKRENTPDLYFLLLENFPLAERILAENHLCSGDTHLPLSDSFFEFFHDGRIFPFRERDPKFFGYLKLDESGKVYQTQSIRCWWVILPDIIHAFEKQMQ